MHTSALPTPQAEYTGTLIQHAQARSMLPHVTDGHTVPVLCMDIELDNALHNVYHVEQLFPEGHFAQAQAAAHRLKKGMRVTVIAPLITMRIATRNATHIHVIPQEH